MPSHPSAARSNLGHWRPFSDFSKAGVRWTLLRQLQCWTFQTGGFWCQMVPSCPLAAGGQFRKTWEHVSTEINTPVADAHKLWNVKTRMTLR